MAADLYDQMAMRDKPEEAKVADAVIRALYTTNFWTIHVIVPRNVRFTCTKSCTFL
jgi:hypothetical protein